MPRGSRPGERRGGRQRGTPNKKTLLKNAVFLAAAGGSATEPTRSPLEFMLALMRDPQVPLKDRVLMAEAAAPFVHARPRPPRHSGSPHPMELRARAAKAAAQNGAANAASAGSEETHSLQPALPDGTEQAEPVGGGQAVVVRLASVGPPVTECFEIRPASPLEFLLAVMADPEAEPKERMRAAQVAARYKHRTADAEESTEPVKDEFGFKIDPALASRIRGIAAKCDSLADRSKPSAVEVQEHRGLLTHLREQVTRIECPETYSWTDLKNDEVRLEQIGKQDRGQKKIPPEATPSGLISSRASKPSAPLRGTKRGAGSLNLR